MPQHPESPLPDFLFTPKGKTISVVLVILLLTGVIGVSSSFTTIKPGEVGVIKNNLTGSEEVKLTNGTVVHLPFGLTQVYLLDKTQQSIRMTSRTNRGDRAGDDSVQVKTNDGSNVNIDVEIQYQIIPEDAIDIVTQIGRGTQYTKLIRPYTRSFIRDALGYLSVTEIAEPSFRNAKLQEAKIRMNEEFAKYGIRVVLVMATNPVFNSKYEGMIKDRKAADQDFQNELSAQGTASQEQLERIAEATKLMNVAIRETKGILRGRTTEAEGLAAQKVALAKGVAGAIVTEAEGELIGLKNEAKAIEKEGLTRAEGIRALADAYEKGGIALVREALAEKFRDVLLVGRPYSLANTIDRFRIEKAAAAEAGNTKKEATDG